MTAGELLDLFRQEVVDTAQPYLWSDDFILGALSHAQEQFCRFTDGLPDSSTDAVTKLVITAGVDSYALSPSVLKIRSARLNDTGRPIMVLNQEDMPPRGMYFDGRPGTVAALITGMDENTVRVWPMPNANTAIRLSVFRLPLAQLTDGDNLIVVPAQHQRALLMWAKHLAYGVHDSDAFDRTKSENYEQKFMAYCASATVDQDRARHKPRTVAYGGI